jgi:hypothetical protein
MSNPSNTKIEQRALNTLESIIDEHLTMSYQFNSQDKEMSWDGYIDIFKSNNGDQSKANFDDRVPVQIKGHKDEKQRYIKKSRINYAVSLDDLRIYSKEKGVLYFQIFLCKGQGEVFYNILYPSKILDYLDKAEKRNNEKNINIPFFKLKKDPDTLYNVAKQFSNEGTKQGSAFTPLVQDRIKKEDFDKIEYIKFTAVGVSNPYEALMRLSSGDVCFYGKTSDDKYERPLEWQDGSIFYVDREVSQDIAVGGTIYYQKYKCLAGSNGGMVITLSPNLKLNISEKKIEFKPVSSLDKLNNDAKFLLDLNTSKEFSVAGHEISTTNAFETDFEKRLSYFVELHNALKMISFETSTPWEQFTKEQFVQFHKLVDIFHNESTFKLTDGFYKHLWSFDGKNIPIIINKQKDKIELTHAVYTDKIALFYPDEEDDSITYRVPVFVGVEAEVLSNLYYYDYDLLRKQIDDSDINSKSAPALNDCVLHLIKVFDLNGDYRFLDLADYLMNRLENLQKDKSLFLLNKLQIKKRQGTLNENDIALLNGIEDSDVQVGFRKYVLLEDKEKASTIFDQFTDAQKEFYTEAPIYKLYIELQ